MIGSFLIEIVKVYLICEINLLYNNIKERGIK